MARCPRSDPRDQPDTGSAPLGRPRGEHGFTLVELLVSVVIMAVVAGSLGTVMITVLRTQGTAGDRLANSQSEQLITKYFAADVQQAVAVESGDPNLSGGCSSYGRYGATAGDNVVRFRSVGLGSTTDYVSYRTFDASSEWQLLRVSCTEKSDAEVIVVAHDLDALSDPLTRGVVLVLGTKRSNDVSLVMNLLQPQGGEAFSFTVTGAKTPTGITLPTVAPVAHDPPPDVTDCAVRALVLDPASVPVVSGTLGADVQVTAVLEGLCALDWSAAYTPGATPVTTPLAASAAAPGTYTGTIPGGTSVGARSDWPSPPSSRSVNLEPLSGPAPPSNTATLGLDAPPVTTTPTTVPPTTAPSTTTSAPATTVPSTTTTVLTSKCQLKDTTPDFGGSAKLEDDGKLKQDLRLVMQPTTDKHFCHDLAIRFTTKDGKVRTIRVKDDGKGEGQNVTAKIPEGYGPFAIGATYKVDIIDTSAGDVKIGSSEFTTWK